MARYPDISEHGLIGDLQTAALVATDGTVDWFCCPRFDSPSVFASLLDADKGGYFRIAPDASSFVTRQLYHPDTAMLITRFMTVDGVGEVTDFMPVAGEIPTSRHRLVRLVRVVRGSMRFVAEIRPRFNYGRAAHRLTLTEDGAVFRADDGMELTLHSVDAPAHGRFDAKRIGDDLHLSGTLREGQASGVVLESMGGEPRRLPEAELEKLAADTAQFWRDWVNRSSYRGRWREMVARSATTLKLMTYAPTGAIVAAPTAGLPEEVGGERNWDYRYTWVRDGSFSIYALLGLGYLDEAAAFARWMRERTEESVGEASGPLKIMYRIDGSSDLTEEVLEHFEGWRGSRPVRIGNGAADQLQLDIYGEAMGAMFHGDARGLEFAHQGWVSVARMMDWLAENWDQPDEGIWETRGGRQSFTYGRFQTWVALDRAIKLAERHGRPANTTRWRTERDRVYEQIMSRGWNPEKGTFVQRYGSDDLDAALLLMPQGGFITGHDPMWLSTLKAMDNELVSDSLVYRYNPSVSPDGLRGDEGTFSLCTFWYVDALTRAGRLDEAQLILQKMFTYANHVGLYSEEISATGEQLGNFPQAFSHLALINAAINLDQQLDRAAAGLAPTG